MNWLRPENITASNRPDPYEQLEKFSCEYGRVGKIILEVYEEIDPLNAWWHRCEEDYYLDYVEKFIRFALATPQEYLMRQDIRADLVEISFSDYRPILRQQAEEIARIITERVNGLDAED